MLKRIIATLVLPFVTLVATAQTEVTIPYNDNGRAINLQAFEYRPARWNGQVIVMSHGSAGKRPWEVLKYTDIARQATNAGYIFLTYMRKGRGGSGGEYTEEGHGCGVRAMEGEVAEGADQLKEVVRQAKLTYRVNRVFLMGHSRGGFLSAVYAAQNPQDVNGVVNLVGLWSSKCEQRNGFSRSNLEYAASRFNRQIWVYITGDSFFSASNFGDPDYEWVENTANRYGVKFLKYKNSFFQDGHYTPHTNPGIWSGDAFSIMNNMVN